MEVLEQQDQNQINKLLIMGYALELAAVRDVEEALELEPLDSAEDLQVGSIEGLSPTERFASADRRVVIQQIVEAYFKCNDNSEQLLIDLENAVPANLSGEKKKKKKKKKMKRKVNREVEEMERKFDLELDDDDDDVSTSLSLSQEPSETLDEELSLSESESESDSIDMDALMRDLRLLIAQNSDAIKSGRDIARLLHGLHSQSFHISTWKDTHFFGLYREVPFAELTRLASRTIDEVRDTTRKAKREAAKRRRLRQRIEKEAAAEALRDDHGGNSYLPNTSSESFDRVESNVVLSDSDVDMSD